MIFNPAAIVAIHPEPAKTIVSPFIATDTILTPVAVSYFHHLPLARALKHPISIDEAREAASEKERKTNEDIVAQKLNQESKTVADVNTTSIDGQRQL